MQAKGLTPLPRSDSLGTSGACNAGSPTHTTRSNQPQRRNKVRERPSFLDSLAVIREVKGCKPSRDGGLFRISNESENPRPAAAGRDLIGGRTLGIPAQSPQRGRYEMKTIEISDELAEKVAKVRDIFNPKMPLGEAFELHAKWVIENLVENDVGNLSQEAEGFIYDSEEEAISVGHRLQAHLAEDKIDFRAYKDAEGWHLVVLSFEPQKRLLEICISKGLEAEFATANELLLRRWSSPKTDDKMGRGWRTNPEAIKEVIASVIADVEKAA